jgi:hypothetical protein
LGQKIKSALAFNHRVVAQNIFTFKVFKALEPRCSMRINHREQAYKANKQATKHNTPIKRKALKERTKDRLDPMDH